MSSPFIYSKTRHTRTQKPFAYKNYKSYKRTLRREFDAKCVYCLMPDSMLGWAQFGADHYRPQALYPELATTYTNLFYCCNACNSRKGDYWPRLIGQSGYFIPNPCDHVMFDHLRYDNAKIVGKSRQGAFTIELLDLDSREKEDYREEMLHLIDVNEKHIREIDSTIKGVEAAFAAGKCSREVFDETMIKIKKMRDVTARSLSRQMGTLYKTHSELYGK